MDAAARYQRIGPEDSELCQRPEHAATLTRCAATRTRSAATLTRCAATRTRCAATLTRCATRTRSATLTCSAVRGRLALVHSACLPSH